MAYIKESAKPTKENSQKRHIIPHLKIYYQNVGGLRNKLPELTDNINKSNYDIITLTDTGLNGTFVLYKHLHGKQYNIFRRDQYADDSENVDGGVLIAIRDDISASLIDIPENPGDLDLIALNIRINNASIYLIVVNMTCEISSSKYSNLAKVLNSISSSKRNEDEIIVIGDFNLWNVHWEPSEEGSHMNARVDCAQQYEMTLIDSINTLGLYQMNNVKNCENRIPDLLFATCLQSNIVLSHSYKSLVPEEQRPALKIDLFNITSLKNERSTPSAQSVPLITNNYIPEHQMVPERFTEKLNANHKVINFENMAGLEKTESPVIYQYIVERMEESDDDDIAIRLINEVSKRPVLYQNYQKIVEDEWKKVHEALGGRISIEHIRKKWKNIRDRHLKSKKESMRKYKYSYRLQFLDSL